jgi:hypothetical protein
MRLQSICIASRRRWPGAPVRPGRPGKRPRPLQPCRTTSANPSRRGCRRSRA